MSDYEFYKSKKDCYYLCKNMFDKKILKKYNVETKKYEKVEEELPKDAYLFSKITQTECGQRRRYGDSYYCYEITFENNDITEEDVVNFIQINLDIKCKKHNDENLYWYEDRYTIQKLSNEKWRYERTSPYID